LSKQERIILKNVLIAATSFALLMLSLPLQAQGTQKSIKDADIYTLYSTNYPQGRGRSGVATFDLSSDLFNRAMCEDAADLFTADFEKLKASSRYDGTTKMRYWCEKGRFRP
jgi:hypothetical protein